MDRQRRSYFAIQNDCERQPLRSINKKWPVLFWFVLKVLGIFYHKSVVTERKCFCCHVASIAEEISLGRVSKYNLHLDSLNIAYELDSTETYHQNQNTEVTVMTNDELNCEVCESLWWDSKRIPTMYTEREIGARIWSHRGSAWLSTGIIVASLALLMYDLSTFLPKLFAKSDQILHLLIMMTLFLLLMVHQIMCLCSKLRSYFKPVHRLSWATALNARYLVKRAQILDLQHKGLPGKPFFFLCTVCPLTLMIYRFIIFVVISECPTNVYKFSHSLIGVFLLESWGLFIYLLFFVRVSFQRQFNLLIGYIKEYEGDLKRCRGTLYDVLADFKCYKELCNIYTVLMFPLAVLSFVSNLTWTYMSSTSCVNGFPQSLKVQIHLLILAWLELVTTFAIYTIALGGWKVEYIWEAFHENVLQLRSTKYPEFWTGLLCDCKDLMKASNAVLASIVCSVVGIYLAFNIQDQDLDFLTNSCNFTITNPRCI